MKVSLKFVKIVGATAPNGSEGGLLKRPCSPRAFVSYSCPGTFRRAWPLSSGGRKSQIPARAGRAPAGGSAASAPAAPRFRGLPTALRAPWLVGASLRARLHAARSVTPPLSCTRTLDGESWALWLQDPLKATGPQGAGGGTQPLPGTRRTGRASGGLAGVAPWRPDSAPSPRIGSAVLKLGVNGIKTC